MAYPMPPGLDAAVVGVGGLEDVERLRRVGEEGLDLAQHCRAVGLERQQVVAAPVEDHLRGVGLRVHRVAGDQEAVERQGLEQGAGGERLVLPLGHRPLGDGDARAGAEGGDDMQGRAPRRPVERAAQRLAVDGEHPVAHSAEVVEKGLRRRVRRRRDRAAGTPGRRCRGWASHSSG